MSKRALQYRTPEGWLADAELVTPLIEQRRLDRIEEVLAHRTRHITVVAEDTNDPHNVAALVRTCDAFGLLDLHAITAARGIGTFQPSRRVSKGTSRWIDTYTWESTEDCLTALKQQGYRIAITAADGPITLQDIDWTEPTAIVMGNEHDGVSETARERADFAFRIPMFGFVESLNISVATALCVHMAHSKWTEARGSVKGDLSEEERALLRARWTLEAVPRVDEIVENLRSRK